ncbi:MAG: hypothetical protein OQK79_11060 [Rhodanobacter sp.]|nr:hypothetical protein [Rhodanobacter sp.]
MKTTLHTVDWYWMIEHLATAVAGTCRAPGVRGLVGLWHRLRVVHTTPQRNRP